MSILPCHLCHLCHLCQFYYPSLVKHLSQPCWLSDLFPALQHCSFGNSLVTGVSDKSFVNLPHCVILVSFEERLHPTFLNQYFQAEKARVGENTKRLVGLALPRV